MSKEPWEEYPNVWKTKAQYFTWLRGALRKVWSDYPIRKEWKTRQLRALTAEEKAAKKFHPSTKNVGQCVFCKEWMAGSKLECDHIQASEGCYDYASANKFLWYCGGLTGEFFQLACKPCHKIKSYAERQGVTFEEARITKEAIAWQKEYNPSGQIEYLMELGYTKKQCSSGAKRRQLFIDNGLKELQQEL